MADQQSCPPKGNSDLYGLGIRIGIYVQMLTVQISSMQASLANSDDLLSTAAVIFVLSVGTTLWQQIQEKSVESVEVAAILTLLLAQLLICRVPWWKNQLIMLMFMGEAVALTAMNIWFWFKGMDALRGTCRDDYAFFFAKVSIWHWFRTFNKATSVMAGIGTFSGALAYVIAICWYMIKTPRAFFRGTLINPEDARESAFSAGLNILGIVGMILYVELAIRWNHIEGVNSLAATGQYMPLFVALSQLLSVFYSLAKTGLQSYVSEEEFLAATEDDEDDYPCEHFDAAYGDKSTGAGHLQSQQHQGITLAVGPSRTTQ